MYHASSFFFLSFSLTLYTTTTTSIDSGAVNAGDIEYRRDFQLQRRPPISWMVQVARLRRYRFHSMYMYIYIIIYYFVDMVILNIFLGIHMDVSAVRLLSLVLLVTVALP